MGGDLLDLIRALLFVYFYFKVFFQFGNIDESEIDKIVPAGIDPPVHLPVDGKGQFVRIAEPQTQFHFTYKAGEIADYAEIFSAQIECRLFQIFHG